MNRLARGKADTVAVSILGKEYQVACPAEQHAELLLSARYLDEQMRVIRATGKVIGLERIAVMAALNIAHELLPTRNAAPADAAPADKAAQASLARADTEARADCASLSSLHAKLDEALHQLRQLEMINPSAK